MPIRYFARYRNMYIFAHLSVSSHPQSPARVISNKKKRCLTTQIRRKNNYVTRPHLHITETGQVFACNGSVTLNKLKSNKYSLADYLGDFDCKENVHEVNL